MLLRRQRLTNAGLADLLGIVLGQLAAYRAVDQAQVLADLGHAQTLISNHLHNLQLERRVGGSAGRCRHIVNILVGKIIPYRGVHLDWTTTELLSRTYLTQPLVSQSISLEENVRRTFRMAAKVYGVNFTLRTAGSEFRAFVGAKAAHEKPTQAATFFKIEVSDDEMFLHTAAGKWFQTELQRLLNTHIDASGSAPVAAEDGRFLWDAWCGCRITSWDCGFAPHRQLRAPVVTRLVSPTQLGVPQVAPGAPFLAGAHRVQHARKDARQGPTLLSQVPNRFAAS